MKSPEINTSRRSSQTVFNSLFIVCLTVALSLAVPFIALGDTEAPPRDYARQTENGEYVFVMLAPERPGKYGQTEIRKTYSQSGLYRNDGSNTPLWTVDWYSFAVYPSSDGRHLVQMGPWASDANQLAVAFHRDGNLIKAYAIKDLVVDQSKLKHTVSHFFWHTSLQYDDKQGLLILRTTDGRNYRFSIKTGEVETEAAEPAIRQPGGKEPRNEAQQEKRMILRRPVEVTASIIELRRPAKDFGGTCDIDVAVQKEAKEFMLHTSLTGVNDARDAFEAIRKGTRWKGKYLFVRTECGGGNAWRCNRDAVFTVSAGRLLSLGQLFAGDREEPARSYKDGCFWDIYDKFEMNGLTDHARAPAFWVALREKNGTLKTDTTRTWLRNRPDFQKRMSEIRAVAGERGTTGDRGDELEALLLTNAVLAKYCGRANDTANLERLASTYLEPARLEIFRNILLHVEPGEYPPIFEKE